ncbi:MAG: hypothetical protein AB7O96_13170 [Pseudobdellovibrionaceae bacterium]
MSMFLSLVAIVTIFFNSTASHAIASDYFNYFSDSYSVTKRVCSPKDQICSQVDTIMIVKNANDVSYLRELGQGKLLEETALTSYGDSTQKGSFAVLYGSPDLAAWHEEIKNSQNQTVQENAVGIKQTVNPNEEGPTFLYSLGKSRKDYQNDPTKIQNRKYELTRNGEP